MQLVRAREAYERTLAENVNHPKALQQLGWLYHQPTPFANNETAAQLLTRSIDIGALFTFFWSGLLIVSSDPTDTQSWYLLGRVYMAQQMYTKAYDAYQQAVYRDNRNPTFWCSIGVLYFQINQYRDALDAYSRAIRLNPYMSEVWFDLGTLYEACSQTNDALDAYQRAADLDHTNVQIKHRLAALKQQITSGFRYAFCAPCIDPNAPAGRRSPPEPPLEPTPPPLLARRLRLQTRPHRYVSLHSCWSPISDARLQLPSTTALPSIGDGTTEPPVRTDPLLLSTLF